MKEALLKRKLSLLFWYFNNADKVFVGKKPPDEITVIDKLNETKDLKSKIFSIKKIKKVKKV